MQRSKNEHPISIVSLSLSHILSLDISPTTILDPQIVEQLIDCLRSSGRFKTLQKLTVRIRRDIVMSPLWSLFRDPAVTLEELELELELDSGDNAFIHLSRLLNSSPSCFTLETQFCTVAMHA
jgi:hypothetical protein